MPISADRWNYNSRHDGAGGPRKCRAEAVHRYNAAYSLSVDLFAAKQHSLEQHKSDSRADDLGQQNGNLERHDEVGKMTRNQIRGYRYATYAEERGELNQCIVRETGGHQSPPRLMSNGALMFSIRAVRSGNVTAARNPMARMLPLAMLG